MDLVRYVGELFVNSLLKPGNRWKAIAILPLFGILLRYFPTFVIIILVSFVGFIVVTYVKPSWLLDFANWANLKRNGFSVKYQDVGDFRFCYAERGTQCKDKPSMLFLHGYTATKEMWFPMVQALPSDRHLIMLDMPGHGGSTQRIDYTYTLSSQASRVGQFVLAVGLSRKPFHLIGISMGGGVAGVYAATHVRDICKLTLMCPVGVGTSDISDFNEAINAGNLPGGMIPSTIEEYKKVMPFVFHNSEQANVPNLYLWMACEMRKPLGKLYSKILVDITSDMENILNKKMHGIEAPTQVLWGKQDRLLHPAGAKVLGEGIEQCDVHMLDNCGHTIPVERPYRTAKIIKEFMDL